MLYFWEKNNAIFLLVVYFILSTHLCCVRSASENNDMYLNHRANANIFLDEQDLSLGKSETHVANMLESHLFSQIKGMVDAHGETSIQNQGKTDTKFHSSDLLKGQGKGKGRHRNRHKGKNKVKMTESQRQAAQLENRLKMETHAKTWAKTQARAMAKAAAAQQAKETQRLRAEAAAAAHDELMVLSRMEMDLHKAQRATAASLPKLELNPRLARKAPKLLTEDEKLLEMLKHPERYVEKHVDLDHPAIPARPNKTIPLITDKLLKAVDDIMDSSNKSTPTAINTNKKNINSNSSSGKSQGNKNQSNIDEAKHAKHIAIARHVVEKIQRHHQHKKNISEEHKKPHARATSFINLASFLNLDASILNGHSLEHLRPKKATNHHYRKHHLLRHHAAAPTFWPKRRKVIKKASDMRFRQGKADVSKNMKSLVNKVFSHPFWHSRPTAQQQMQQKQAQQQQQQIRFQQQYMKQNGQFFSTRGQSPQQQYNNGNVGGYSGNRGQQRQPQRKNTMDSPFGFNDLNSQLGNDAARDFQNVRNDNNAAAARNSNNFGSGSGGLESPANGGLPSMATSNTRPTDPTIGVGSSGGNPFAGKMPPPSAVKYSYGQDARNSRGLRPPPPPPAAVPPPPPVGQGSNAMPGPHPVKPGSSSNSINSAFLPQTPQAGAKPISAPPPPLPMAPQHAGVAGGGNGPKPVMSPSVVTTIPFKRGARL
jgi:hypothetical protein